MRIFQIFKRQRNPFNIVAKLTQPRYGIISQPANREMRKNIQVVSRIASHNARITAKAKPALCKPKNTGDQMALRISWIENTARAWTTRLVLRFRQTAQAASPMHMYNAVQTGPNSQFGGLNEGLFNWLYHSFGMGPDNNCPAKGAIKHIPTKTGINKNSFFCSFPIMANNSFRSSHLDIL